MFITPPPFIAGRENLRCAIHPLPKGWGFFFNFETPEPGMIRNGLEGARKWPTGNGERLRDVPYFSP